MASENTVQRSIWLAVCGLSICARVVLWRVNTGLGWVGKGKPVRNPDGSVTLHGARPVTLGFGAPDGRPVVGASDLCGLTSVTVTPEMVGQKVAVFTAIEAKRTKNGRTTKEQLDFHEFVRGAGGIAGVANTPAVAQSIVTSYCRDRGIR